ncbi:type I secretion C-terminal target domain-containing protein [Egbenema bharatensis]|uniref:type I secretion C-terminal target domain-containing protein n=1 Tax=Egbenema bharatensis TaxID=3463334 RepID=UPI003A8BB331
MPVSSLLSVVISPVESLLNQSFNTIHVAFNYIEILGLEVSGLGVEDFNLTRDGVEIDLDAAGVTIEWDPASSSYKLTGLAPLMQEDGEYFLELVSDGSGITASIPAIGGLLEPLIVPLTEDASVDWVLDMTAPVASIVPINEVTEALDSIRISFTEDVTGFDIQDLILKLNGEVVDLTNASLDGSGSEYILSGLGDLTGEVGEYILSLKENSGIVDAAGNPIQDAVLQSWSLVEAIGGGGTGGDPIDGGGTGGDPIDGGGTGGDPIDGGGTGGDPIGGGGTGGDPIGGGTGTGGGNTPIGGGTGTGGGNTPIGDGTGTGGGNTPIGGGTGTDGGNTPIGGGTGGDPLMPFDPMSGATATAPIDRFARGKFQRRMRGTKNADRMKGTNKNDVILGRGGNDRINGRGGNDHIDGGAGDDRINGGKGNDLLRGGAGNDTLIGGAGDDVLIGGMGNDVLIGGAGKDRFVFNSLNEGTNTIRDFQVADDLIDLRGIFRTIGATPADLAKVVQLEQVGSATQVSVDTDGLGAGTVFKPIVQLNNVAASTLSSSNFVVG